MKRPCYTEKALSGGDPFDVFLECIEDVKATVGEALDCYHPMDTPIICAGLKLVTAALETHPAVGSSGRALEEHILEHIQMINMAGLNGLEDQK